MITRPFAVDLVSKFDCLLLRSMKRLLAYSVMISLTTIMLILSSATVYAGGYLQYDGVYACYDKGGDLPSTQYYRFYPDKTVIEVASTGSLAQIQRWFNKESAKGFGLGKITQLRGNKVSFHTRLNGKLYQYSGEIDGDLIRIKESRWLWGKDTIGFVRFSEPSNIPNCR
jgi:opacity protein-like surface antigen